MNLVNTKETYERVYTECPDEVKPMFLLRKLTFGEVASINDSISAIDEQNRIVYKGGTSSRLKINYSVSSWRNILDDSGKEAVCNDANKEKLPPDVCLWLVREIDKLNSLSGISESERKN